MISRTYDETLIVAPAAGRSSPWSAGRPAQRPRLIKPANEAAVSRPVSKIDRKAYMRDLMRRLRAEKRAARAALALALPTLALGCRHCPLNPVTLVACPGVTGVTVTAFSTGFGRSSPFPRPSPT